MLKAPRSLLEGAPLAAPKTTGTPGSQWGGGPGPLSSGESWAHTVSVGGEEGGGSLGRRLTKAGGMTP